MSLRGAYPPSSYFHSPIREPTPLAPIDRGNGRRLYDKTIAFESFPLPIEVEDDNGQLMGLPYLTYGCGTESGRLYNYVLSMIPPRADAIRECLRNWTVADSPGIKVLLPHDLKRSEALVSWLDTVQLSPEFADPNPPKGLRMWMAFHDELENYIEAEWRFVRGDVRAPHKRPSISDIHQLIADHSAIFSMSVDGPAQWAILGEIRLQFTYAIAMENGVRIKGGLYDNLALGREFATKGRRPVRIIMEPNRDVYVFEDGLSYAMAFMKPVEIAPDAEE